MVTRLRPVAQPTDPLVGPWFWYEACIGKVNFPRLCPYQCPPPTGRGPAYWASITSIGVAALGNFGNQEVSFSRKPWFFLRMFFLAVSNFNMFIQILRTLNPNIILTILKS